MEEKMKYALQNYLTLTYSRRDSAIILREATNTLCEMTGAASIKFFLFQNENVFLFTAMSDGSYQLHPDEQSAANLMRSPNAFPLFTKASEYYYGMILLEACALQAIQTLYIEKICKIVGEQLYHNLVSSEFELLITPEKRLIPEDGSLPHETFAILVHEMRSPIATALATLEVMKKRLEMQSIDYPQYLRLCETLEGSLRRSMRMNTNLLLSSRDIRSIPPLEWLDVCNIWYRIAHNASAYAQQNNIQLLIEKRIAPYATQLIQCNEQYVESIVSNLLSNALHHAPKENGIVNVIIENNNETLTLIVKDNGKGFSDDIKEQLFQKFWRDSSNEQFRHSGAGLGLYLVKMFVRALGGTVSANGKNGAVFTVTLPIHKYQRSTVLQVSSHNKNQEFIWNTAENEFIN